MALTAQQVETLYLAYLGRKGSVEEVAGWQTLEITQEVAAAGFYNSPEAQARGLTDNATYINQIYNDLFNRDAEKAGLDGWLQLLANGFPRDQIALAIANAALSNPSGADAQTLQAAISDVPPGPGPGPEPTPGATFMLTEGVDYADAGKSTHDNVADTFKFTDASEKITATFAQLSKGDQLIDLSNADNDTLALSLDINDVKQTIGSKNGATLVNIEELDITSRGAKNITFDNTISAAGLKTIKIAGAFLNDKGNDGNGFTFSGNVLKTLTTIDASAITAGNVNINASKATQDLTITGPNSAASINGGSGNDTITGQGTINGGDSDDIITITGKSDVTGGNGKDTFDVQAGKVTITDLGVGKDIIKVAAGAEVTANVGSGWTATADSTNDGTLTFKLGSGANVNLVELVGHEKVNLVVESGTGSATVTGLNATDLTSVASGATLNIFGSGEEGVTIDLSKASVAGNVVITGTAEADTITTAATGSTTVDAGAGADTISLGAGKDTVVFAATAAANGEDEITGFTAGASGDVLNVAAFLSSSASVGTGSSDTELNASGKNVIVLNSIAAAGSSNVTNLTSGGKYVVVISDGTDSNVYYYTNGSSTSMSLSALASAVTDNVATLVGVSDASVVTLVADNFVGS